MLLSMKMIKASPKSNGCVVLLCLGIAFAWGVRAAEPTNAASTNGVSADWKRPRVTVEINALDEIARSLKPTVPQPWWTRWIQDGPWFLTTTVLGLFIYRSHKRFEAALALNQLFSKARYETELNIYRDMWKFASALQDDIGMLILFPKKEGSSPHFAESFSRLWDAVQHNRPFYPPEVWNEFQELLTFCKKCGLNFPVQEINSWEESSKNLKENQQQLEENLNNFEGAIRERLLRFDSATLRRKR